MALSHRHLAAMLAVACTACADDITNSAEALQVTNQWMAEELPQVTLRDMEIETIDMGDRWRISYQYPGGGTGGPLIFVVNKRSGKIVHMETEQ